jgi:hypothetical protein
VLAFGTGVMINRDCRGHSYFIVRGEILGFMLKLKGIDGRAPPGVEPAA